MTQNYSTLLEINQHLHRQLKSEVTINQHLISKVEKQLVIEDFYK